MIFSIQSMFRKCLLIWVLVISTTTLPSQADGKSETGDKRSGFVVPDFMLEDRQVRESDLPEISKIPFFSGVDVNHLFIRTLWKSKIDGLNIEVMATRDMSFGGNDYPAGAHVIGRNNLFRIYLKPGIQLKVNGVKVCRLGQHAQTLEIFEIKLCEDSEINGVKIPGGSKVAFKSKKTSQNQTWNDLGCLVLGKDTVIRGRAVKSGEHYFFGTKDGIPPKGGEWPCEVVTWHSYDVQKEKERRNKKSDLEIGH
ncbi:MAG: hypothetical protein H6624_01200 [Bdellovibrionaceae bacterium]|nr:hypothetical protein [Bdellovibrionales bacterium]MCB9082925.1 hypothetical protein [Pseudobdellovibrionaceae bacterium]